MAYNLKDEEEVKQYIENLGIEYRFGCFKEKKPEVCHLLGDYLEAIKKDFSKAGKIYKSNCDDYNFGRSCYKYGTYSLLGKGGHKLSADESYEYYKKGCELGVADSCFNVGMMCINSGKYGRSKVDHVEGLQYLEKSCSNKQALACFYLGSFYIKGLKDGNIAVDMKKAFSYMEKSCEFGHVHGCANLSQMYMKGDGVAKDVEKAERYKKLVLEIEDQYLKQQQTLNFQQGVN